MVNEMSIETQGPGETERLGQALGRILESGDVILLFGDLGAGKTTFTKGVARGLDILDDITSPTFTLVALHEGRIPLAHMDLYRLYGEDTDPAVGKAPQLSEDTLAQIGWDDYLESDCAVLVEWPQGIQDLVMDALIIRIERGPMPKVDERTFHCTAIGHRSFVLLDEWVKQWLF